MNQENIYTRNLSDKKTFFFLLAGIIFIASTLRSPLTSVGPIIGDIREGVGMSYGLAGFLTTIPLLAFALISPVVPRISKRYGMELTLFLSLCILTVGILLRSAGNLPLLITGTFLIGVGISFGNVLLPGLLKLNFPLRVGLMTGIYSVSMNISATIASGISVPVAEGTRFGWQGALGVWAILTLIAIVIWIPQLKFNSESKVIRHTGAQEKPAPLYKSPLAWAVTFFMGLQSLLFYTTSAWMPEVLISRGVSAEQAGWLLALLQFSQLPMTFIVPILAAKAKDQRLLVAAAGTLFLTGYGGVLFGSSSLSALWMISIGIAGGTAFGLSMMFFTLRTETHTEAANLSGMAQSVGYLFAAIGPVLFGMLHDWTGSWTSSLSIFMVVSVLSFLSGMKAGKDEKTSVPV